MPAGDEEHSRLKRAVVVVSLVASILLFLWWAPVPLFNAGVIAAALLATHELYAMFDVGNSDRVLRAIGLAGAAALLLQMVLLPSSTLSLSIPLLIMLVFSVLAFKTKSPDRKELETAFVVLFGALYMPIMMGQLIPIRASEHGREWAATIVVTVFAREISAHFAGSLLPAGRPLNINVNERKSYVGAAIGIVAASVASLLMSRALIVDFPTLQAIVLGASLGIACQLGDLSESYLKRVAGSRHSGKILGPEGGVLDFVDAAAFAIVTARLLLLVWKR